MINLCFLNGFFVDVLSDVSLVCAEPRDQVAAQVAHDLAESDVFTAAAEAQGLAAGWTPTHEVFVSAALVATGFGSGLNSKA